MPNTITKGKKLEKDEKDKEKDKNKQNLAKPIKKRLRLADVTDVLVENNLSEKIKKHTKSKSRYKFSNSEIIKALRTYAKRYRHSPTTRQWNEYCKGKKDIPSERTIRNQFGPWNYVLKEAKLALPRSKRGGKIKYSNSQIIKALQTCANTTGHSPTIKQWNKYCKGKKNVPSVVTIIYRFGSWKDALKKAKLSSPKRKRRKRKFSNSQIIKALQTYAKTTAHSPTIRQWNEYCKGKKDIPSITVIKNHFGSLNAALNEAKLSSPKRKKRKKQKRKFSNSKIIKALQTYTNITGHLPTTRQWDEYCKGNKEIPSRPTIINQFGPWNVVLKEVKLAIIKKIAKRKYSNLKIIKALQTYAEIYRHSPTIKQWNKYCKGKKDIPSVTTIRNQFGSWYSALNEAKLPLPKRKKRKRKFSNSQIIKALQRYAKTTRHSPTVTQWNEYRKGKKHVPSTFTIRNQFGSWNSALKKAELLIRKRRSWETKYSNLEIIKALKTYEEIYEHSPTTTQWNKYRKGKKHIPCINTIKNHFGSLNAALNEANLPLIQARYSDLEIIEALQTYAKTTRHSPTIKQWNKYCKGKKDIPSVPTIRNQFGSWYSALNEAKLPLPKRKRRKRKFSNSQIIKVLQTYAKTTRHSPTTIQWNEYRKGKKHVPSTFTIRNQFGSWNAALTEAKLAIRKRGRKRKYSDLEITKALQTYAEIYRHSPTTTQWKKYHKVKFKLKNN